MVMTTGYKTEAWTKYIHTENDFNGCLVTNGADLFKGTVKHR